MNESTSSKRVVINSIIYSCSCILMKCFSFFLLPLYTAYLSTEDYAISSLATSFTTTMSFIVALSLYSAIMRFYVDLKKTPEKLRRFYGTVSLFSFLSGIVWMLLFTVFRAPLSKYVFSNVPFFPIILVAIVEMIFFCQVTIFDDILKSQQKALKSSIINLISFLLKIGLNVLVVVVYRLGALGTLLSALITDVLYTLYFVISFSRAGEIRFFIDLKLLKEALRYSIPIMPHNLSTRIALLVSKVLIGDVASLASLGIYSVAAQFGDIADTLQGYVDKAYQPWLYEKLSAGEKNYKESIRETVRMLTAVLGFLFLAIAFFAQDYILLFVNKAYADSWRYIPFIILVFAIKTAYYFYVEVLFYNKKSSKILFTSTLTSNLLNVFLSFFLIPAYGVIGSIAADAIAMLVRVAIVVIISRRIDDVGLKLKDFIANFFVICAFLAAGMSLSYLKFGNTFSIINLLFKTGVLLAYVALVYFKYRKQLIELLRSFFKSGRRSGQKTEEQMETEVP